MPNQKPFSKSKGCFVTFLSNSLLAHFKEQGLYVSVFKTSETLKSEWSVENIFLQKISVKGRSKNLSVNRWVHAWRGIMGNQGKISRKQGSKMYVFLHISILISNLVTKHIQFAEKPLFKVYQHFWVDRVNVVGAQFFLWLNPKDLIKS